MSREFQPIAGKAYAKFLLLWIVQVCRLIEFATLKSVGLKYLCKYQSLQSKFCISQSVGYYSQTLGVAHPATD